LSSNILFRKDKDSVGRTDIFTRIEERFSQRAGPAPSWVSVALGIKLSAKLKPDYHQDSWSINLLHLDSVDKFDRGDEHVI
jgi:hypothetical protein